MIANKSAQPPGLRWRATKARCIAAARSRHSLCSTPPCPRNPAAVFLGEAQAGGAAAVKQVGVLHRRQNCEEALYASGLRIVQVPALRPSRSAGSPTSSGVRKAGGCLRPRAARAELAQRVRPMAVQRDGAAQYRLPPSLAHGGAQHVGAPMPTERAPIPDQTAPAAAHSSPRPKIAPRCVLTPPVAASIARSASTPISRNLSMPDPAAPATAR